MSYFSHAFHKTFLATKGTVAASGTPGQPNAQVGLEGGIITTAGIGVEYLKSTSPAEGYQLGPGVVGFFDEKTNLSVTAADIATGCCNFYIASASLITKDKIGPFHGGYMQSNKSKYIQPRRILSTYFADSNASSAAFMQIGNTPSNVGGQILTSSVNNAGTGYTSGSTVAVTGGTGFGATVTINTVTASLAITLFTSTLPTSVSRVAGTYNAVASTGGTGTGATFNAVVNGFGSVSSFTLASGGTGYTVGDVLTISDAVLGGGGAPDLTVTVTQVVTTGPIATYTFVNRGHGYTVNDVITLAGGTGGALNVLSVSATAECSPEFVCGQTYYLRVEVKGTDALRFLNHNLYTRLDAYTGCCADPSAPDPVDPVSVYSQWATQIAEDPIFKDFVRPILVVDGIAYVYDADVAAEEGISTSQLISNAPTTSTHAGLILKGAYAETKFGNCSFTPSDYYSTEPLQIYASLVDMGGNPCDTMNICITETCPGIQANGLGESVLRNVLLSESYLQNHFATDNRIREITEGDNLLASVDRNSLYSVFYIKHEVPRPMNPSSAHNTDHYVLEIVGDEDTTAYLEAEFDTLATQNCIVCGSTEDFTAVPCDLPDIENL